jgi:hypothetical protein
VRLSAFESILVTEYSKFFQELQPGISTQKGYFFLLPVPKGGLMACSWGRDQAESGEHVAVSIFLIRFVYTKISVYPGDNSR